MPQPYIAGLRLARCTDSNAFDAGADSHHILNSTPCYTTFLLCFSMCSFSSFGLLWCEGLKTWPKMPGLLSIVMPYGAASGRHVHSLPTLLMLYPDGLSSKRLDKIEVLFQSCSPNGSFSAHRARHAGHVCCVRGWLSQARGCAQARILRVRFAAARGQIWRIIVWKGVALAA